MLTTSWSSGTEISVKTDLIFISDRSLYAEHTMSFKLNVKGECVFLDNRFEVYVHHAWLL